MRLPAFGLCLLALTGCGGECAIALDLDMDTVRGDLDGTDWTAANATWLWQGESVKISAPISQGYTLSLVAQSTTDGLAIQEAVDAGEYPFDISLAGADAGGWVVLYGTDSGPFNSQDGAGTLTVGGAEDSGYYGCLTFTATDGQQAMTFDGAWRTSVTAR